VHAAVLLANAHAHILQCSLQCLCFRGEALSGLDKWPSCCAACAGVSELVLGGRDEQGSLKEVG